MRRRFYFFALLILFVPMSGWGAEMGSPEAAVKRLYKEGRYDEIIQALEGKEGTDAQEALYLGLSHLQNGNQSKAIAAWKQYVQLEPGSEGSREVSKYLTVLLQEEAKRTAREILKEEKQIAAKIDARAIAVSPFQNLGQQSYAPLSKGLAAMIITDLSKVKTLKVVERVQLKALLDELKLSQSGLVDAKSAPRVGKLLGAGKITTGSFLDLDQEKIRLDAAVTQTESGKSLTNPEVQGTLPTFYQLEKELVFKILCGIGHCPESLDSQTQEAVGTIHTRNFKAFRLYSQGLEYLDQGKYREASHSFFLAVEEDPEFELARRALLDTPLFPLDLAAMISGAEAIGDGGTAILSTGTVFAAPQLPQSSAGHQAMAPSIGMLTPPTSVSAGSPPPSTVPVQIDVQF
jgi:TolB-like protein